ncbi:Por secretion system C-terminal sorting domain-containing protein [Dyadobacter soli]|uniref:Por secretion system C-terminal sorting domain-containing protein n=1 Tax=Dyadobacter soli TaxID=659014 RepID=A0A1G7PVA2_9BACT|nr:T9SS type A sorting domain-containing protein [Dyadobacter soli]SDF90178.1 Por secretion system C-terminal sorting domain-containing protein [Dyadobacter soli]
MPTLILLLQRSMASIATLLFSLSATISLAQAVNDSPTRLINLVVLSRPQETSTNTGFALFSSNAQVIAAFNKGRRFEEAAFGFPANSLGIFSLPAGYDSFTPAQRALYIINGERTARAGFDYGNGPVLGKPLEGVETTLCDIAAKQAFFVDSTKIFTSIGPDGSTGIERILAAFGTNCVELLGRAGSYYTGGSLGYAVENAIFEWLYRDGASGGNRMLMLLQTRGVLEFREGSPMPVVGFKDNHGAAGSEGFLGIGVSHGVVVLEIIDPGRRTDCAFSVEQNPLPVHLISWNGIYETNTIKLDWETAWEENSDYFLVQRSTDLKTFQTLTKVASKGTTRDQQRYEWVDTDPRAGINYYRLVQTDVDETTETSRIIAVRNDMQANENLAVYPNPSHSGEAFRVKAPGNAGNIALYDIVGRECAIVVSAESEGELIVKPTEALPAGMYSLIVVENGRKRHGRVFVK